MERKAQVPLTPDLAKRVADYRFENRINTEAEAIRRLIELGLEAVAKGASSDS